MNAAEKAAQERATRAALQVFGYSELPASFEEVQAKCVKLLADEGITETERDLMDTRPAKRILTSFYVLTTLMKVRDMPDVQVKFGEGEPKQAFVSENISFPDSECNFEVRLRWFYGLQVQVNNGGWVSIDSPQVLECGDVVVQCVE